MKSSQEVKETIKNVVKELIAESTGNVEEITVRAIAAKAGVNVAMINYHFQSKDNLMEMCVQELVGRVVSGYRLVLGKSTGEVGRIHTAFCQIMDFLFDNPSIAKISILSDLKKGRAGDNSEGTMLGLSSLMDPRRSKEERCMAAFMLVSAGQEMFMRRGVNFYGIDVNDKEKRDIVLLEMTRRVLVEI